MNIDMHLELHQIENLESIIGKEFFVPKQYSSTGRAKLSRVVRVKKGLAGVTECSCFIEEVENEYNNNTPQLGEVRMPGLLTHNCYYGR